MLSVRLLSVVALGMAAFSSCSAGEWARSSAGGREAAPIATLSIPAPPATSPNGEPSAPAVAASAPALATVAPLAPLGPAQVGEGAVEPVSEEGTSDDDEEPAPSSQRELGPL